jgi:hypothetical protein
LGVLNALEGTVRTAHVRTTDISSLLNSGRAPASPKRLEASLVEGERPRKINNPGVRGTQRYGEENKVENSRRERYLERGKRVPAQNSP